MKARPRRAENRIADELNLWFAKHNLSPIKRIPVLGREGPDYTYNELKLNLDAKSRKSNPKSHKILVPEMLITKSWLGYQRVAGIRLHDLDFIINPRLDLTRHGSSSITVNRWIQHMGPNGGVILHWPGTSFKNAVLCLNTNTIVHIREVINALKS